MFKFLRNHAGCIWLWRQLTKVWVVAVAPMVLPELELPATVEESAKGGYFGKAQLESDLHLNVVGGQPGSGRLQLRSGLSVEDLSWTPMGLLLDPVQGAGVNLSLMPLYLVNRFQVERGRFGVSGNVEPVFLHEELGRTGMGLRTGYDPLFGVYSAAGVRRGSLFALSAGGHWGGDTRKGGGGAGRVELFKRAFRGWNVAVNAMGYGTFAQAPSIGSPMFPTLNASQSEWGGVTALRFDVERAQVGGRFSLTPFFQTSHYHYLDPEDAFTGVVKQKGTQGGVSWSHEWGAFSGEGVVRYGGFNSSWSQAALKTTQGYQALAYSLYLGKMGRVEPRIELRGQSGVGAFPGVSVNWNSGDQKWGAGLRWTHRLPTLLERFFEVPGWSLANPTLRPERVLQWRGNFQESDAEGEWSWGVGAELAARDHVIATRFEDGVFQRQNFGKAVEGALIGRVGVHPFVFWTVSLEVEGGTSRVFSTGERFPYRPDWKIRGINKFGLGKYWSFEANLLGIGRSEAAGLSISPYLMAALGVSGHYKEASWAFWLENPSGQPVLVDPFQYPVGRSVRVSFQWLL